MTRFPQQRVIAYVDGFNLYFGLRAGGFRRYYWLNVQALAGKLLKPGQRFVLTKYFTARISGPTLGDASLGGLKLEAKRQRQSEYLEALATLPEFRIYEGHFLTKPVTCRACGASWSKPEEKMTDVNIATELLTDVFQDRLDVALLISGDSDLVPPIRAVRTLFPNNRIIVAFPPHRFSAALADAAHGHVKIWARKLARSQFPDRVTKADGTVLQRPERWR